MIRALFMILAVVASAMTATATPADRLDSKEKSVVLIAAFTARGDMARLDSVFDTGLDAGLSVNEIKEILVQMYAYCGFPRALNALNLLMDKTIRRKAAGIHDPIGREATPVAAGTDMEALGEQVRTALVGHPVTGKVYQFCPVIDRYLRAHLFGDIFARDNLSHAYRELATAGALAAMALDGQLRSHLSICARLGYTQAALDDLASTIATEVGRKEGEAASGTVAAIFK
ncbi:MAG: carboxymuconolactone decarboxylase family protein [Bacteroides sp.]|nr:carboxymuconolactone decarboxylase family protein [Bacteroides sp.]MCM1095709.1 carboxymuconolactone decarboxylase family protein [Terasakiella sp.]